MKKKPLPTTKQKPRWQLEHEAWLALPADERAARLERLARLLEAADWVFARTMPENPHEYSTRRTWPSDADFDFAVATIRQAGYRQKFRKHWYQCLDVNEFFFWTMGWPVGATLLINRKPLSAKPREDVP